MHRVEVSSSQADITVIDISRCNVCASTKIGQSIPYHCDMSKFTKYIHFCRLCLIDLANELPGRKIPNDNRN